ncbi:MAG: FAD-dependent oxidoreductase [Alphaproteobacteria bacterium]|nr:FAD-dependent oxidoreductase [Alphaproteobacteria bacterium]
MQESPRIAVVGAGLAGLVAAYRLSRQGFDVTLIESNPARLGGRLFTEHDALGTGRIWERGGELLATDNPLLFTLCEELHLPVYEVSGERGEFSFHIDGESYRACDVYDPATGEGPFTKLAALINYHKSLSLDADGNWHGFARRFDQGNLEAYLYGACTLAGVPRWLARLLDVAYFAENGLPCGEQSALNLIWMLDTALQGSWQPYGSVDDARFRIEGGFEALSRALAREIETQGGSIRFGARLTGIAQEEGESLTLTFATAEGCLQENYDHAVLAVPHPVLATIDGLSAMPLRAEARQGIREIGSARHTKMALRTTHPWSALFPDGALNGNLVMNLEDGSALNAWVSSSDERDSILSVLIAGPLAFASPDTIAAICRREIAAHFGITAEAMFEPSPEAFLVQAWAREPGIGTSYSCPKPNQLHLREALSEPQAFGRLHFAGEAVDPVFQSFAEGAARSGAHAAEQIAAQYRTPAPEKQPAPLYR